MTSASLEKRSPLAGLRGEAAWLLASRVVVALSGFVTLRVLTALLPESLYGQYALFLAFLSLIASFAVGPISQAQNRFLYEAAASGALRGFVRWSLMTVCLAALLGAVLGLPLVWWHAGSNPQWLLIWGCAAAAALFSAVGARAQGFFNTYRWRGRYAVVSTADVWLRLAFLALCAVFIGENMLSLAVAVAAAATLTALAGLPWLRALANEPPPVQRSAATFDLAVVWKFAMPLFGVTLLSWVSSLSDRYIISFSLGDSEVGRYVASYQVASVAPGLLSSLFFPLVSPILYQQMAHRSGQPLHLDRYLMAMAVPGLLLVGLVVVDVRSTCLVLLGSSEYFTGDAVIPWVGSALLLMTLQQVLEHEAIYRKAMRGLLAANALGAAVNLTLNFVLLRRYGISVAAASTLASYVVSMSVILAIYRPSIARGTWGRLGVYLVLCAGAVVLLRLAVPESLPTLLRAPIRWVAYTALSVLIMGSTIRDLIRWRQQPDVSTVEGRA